MRNAVVLICLSLPVPLPTLLADDAPEDKLVQGELIEVSSGDLEKAMAIYKAIEKDEKAPESTRARALLCLARCQRKLGELEAAKKTLGELIRVHANEQEILRQAQSFLQEIEGGRPANSNFDWLKELEKSPEIQARVFDLTMDLLNNDDPKAGSARRQLRALGVIAVPVMERVLEVSRDTRQRLWLASLLVQCGRYERIGVFLDSGQELSWNNNTPEADLMQRVKSFSDEQRRGLIAAIDKHASSAETLKDRCLILLAAGDRRDVLSLVRATEEIAGQRSEAWKTVLGSSDALLRHLLIELAKDPQVADAMAERVLNPACEFAVVNDYVAALVKSSPEKLKAEHWAAYLEGCAATPEWKSQSGAVRSILQILTEQARYDVLLGLAKGRFAENVGEYFAIAYMAAGRGARDAPEAWAAVLRSARPRQYIQWLAEVQDAAIPELVRFLRNRANEEPDYRVVTHEGHGADWAPSSAYLEAMAGILDDKDPITVAIALEVLSLAPERNPPGAGAMIEKVAKERPDARLREIAIHTLLKGFEADPMLGSAAASALFQEFQARMDVPAIPQDYLDSQLARLPQIGGLQMPAVAAGSLRPVTSRRSVRIGPPVPGRPIPPRTVRLTPVMSPGTSAASSPYLEAMNWIWADVLPESRVALYPHVLALSDSASGARFHDWAAPQERIQALPALCERLSSFRSPEMIASAVSALHDYDIHEQPQAFEFLGRVLADAKVDVNARALALEMIQRRISGSFDWPRLFAGDDPLAVFAAQNDALWTSLLARPEDEQITLFEAGLSSPHEAVRQKSASLLPLNHAATLGLFRKALDDSSAVVRKAAIVRLGAATRADLGPLYVELLTHKDSRLRAAAVERLPKFASVECIEPLTKMLDDPDVDVRESALGALRKVKSALEERKEWQDLAGKLKQGKT